MEEPKEMKGDLPSRLTPRELRILSLTAEGYSSTDIAKIFGTKSQTVRNQKVVICLKLGARGSANAVAIAKDRGLI